MNKVFELIKKVKNTDTNVMITGESGTGKELVARAVHFTGNRKGEPFEVINCAAINPNLLESELFGHEKGAFTGALTNKKGIFELADKGTLFLDEISEMDINLQAKLLRAVQEKEISPVGSQNRKRIDVRIICATNKNLKEEVMNGRFREDLYFRLNVINIHLPPLRERREDIPLLIHYFIEKYNRKMGKNIRALSEEAAELLYSYDYKGNVRELQNIIERSIVLTDGEIINSTDFPSEVYLESSKSVDTRKNGVLIPVFAGEDMETIEKKVILHTLKYNKGNKKQTADMLKISERNLRYKLKEYES
jgi:transcriptional regulator with PAS, ATPase and Fis domain